MKSRKIVTIGGEQFFTDKWILEQMAAQNSSISRSNKISMAAIGVSLLSIILSIALG